MKTFIFISPFTDSALKDCIVLLGDVQFLKEETRINHTAIYPLHNRYFSNGDKPWVILVNFKNTMKLTYDGIVYTIHENELVCFDDNVLHAWEMDNNDIKIYYYRGKGIQGANEGTYCIDEFS